MQYPLPLARDRRLLDLFLSSHRSSWRGYLRRTYLTLSCSMSTSACLPCVSRKRWETDHKGKKAVSGASLQICSDCLDQYGHVRPLQLELGYYYICISMAWTLSDYPALMTSSSLHSPYRLKMLADEGWCPQGVLIFQGASTGLIRADHPPRWSPAIVCTWLFPCFSYISLLICGATILTVTQALAYDNIKVLSTFLLALSYVSAMSIYTVW
jgi:hypothetical protein